MLQFLNPIALAAFAALLIPVLVHLLHRRKGKTLRVGSISLFQPETQRSSSRRRIRNWPLFLLRSALVSGLCLLLAEPVLVKPAGSSSKEQWVLIPATQLSTAYKYYRTTIDSLLESGATLHDLSPGIELISLSDTTDASVKTVSPNAEPHPWSLIRELNYLLPEKFPVTVFAPAGSDLYGGPRPLTDLQLNWYNLPPAASGQTSGINKDEKDTVMNIAIFPGYNREDGRYLYAALQTVRDYSKADLRLQLLGDNDTPAQAQDMVFWLKEEPRPALQSLLKPGASWFEYLPGKLSATNSWLQTNFQPISQAEFIALRTLSTDPASGQTLWTSSTGAPVLSMEHKNGWKIFQSRLRFNPGSSNLVWNEELVRLLASLVLPEPQPAVVELDSQQVIPVKAGSSSQPKDLRSLSTDTSDLSLYIWICTGLLFLAERLLSFRQIRRTID